MRQESVHDDSRLKRSKEHGQIDRAAVDAEFDALLDEIDALLAEVDAEEVVRNFVQIRGE